MQRMAELDGVRGIASVVIVVFHLWFTKRYPTMATAVDLFFVLSGYLITSVLLLGDRSIAGLKTFFVRRAWRIWPIYYLTLVAFLVGNWLLHAGFPTHGWGFYATYTQFVTLYWVRETEDFTRLFNHTWTLAIEEQFYIVWPFFVCLLGRKGILALAVPMIVGSIALGGAGFPRNLLLTHGEGLVLGGLLAALMHDREQLARHRRTIRACLFALGAVAVIVPFVVGRASPGFMPFAPLQAIWPRVNLVGLAASLQIARMSLIYACVIGILVCSTGERAFAPLRSRVLRYLGGISYGLYLYHPLVFVATLKLMTALGCQGTSAVDACRLGLSFGVAALSWQFVERPLLALRDRRSSGSFRDRDGANQGVGGGPTRPTRVGGSRLARIGDRASR